MRVMVLVKASKDSEAGVMPTQQMWEEMDQFTHLRMLTKSYPDSSDDVGERP
jgi:hypothetical protein